MENDNNIKEHLYSKDLSSADMRVALQRRNSAVGIIQPLGPLLQEDKSLLNSRKGVGFCRSKNSLESKPRDVVFTFKKKRDLFTCIYKREKERIRCEPSNKCYSIN